MYIIFGGCCFEPTGGIHDLVGTADTLEDALELVAEHVAEHRNGHWWHIVDKDLNIVKEFG